MWKTEPDPIVISVAIHFKRSMLTLIICYVPPFFSKSFTKKKISHTSLGYTSSTKYQVFASPISYIYLILGGDDGTNGLSLKNTPIIIL